MVHYEMRVFSSVGVWKNIEDLEDSITLDELFHLYQESIDREIRQMQGTAKAFGADIDIEWGPTRTPESDDTKSSFNDMFARAKERMGDSESEEQKQYRKMRLGYSK